ncbi:MAG: hypothetical protein HFJ23_00785 [Clostridia bacterium]|nr:hypothetical protein [Clostridia bacterium]
MKRVITAIGNEELNKMLRKQKDILIESPDIQYQEGIIEAIDKYPKTDIVILYENIIGEIELEDLIRSIIIVKNNIEIILVVDRDVEIQNKEVVKIVKNNQSYAQEILEYLSKRGYIKIQNVNLYNLKSIEKEPVAEILNENVIIKRESILINVMSNMKQIATKVNMKLKRREKKKNVVTVIGNSGSRKNDIHIYTI